MATPDDHSNANAINQRLDEIIAEQRRQRVQATPLREPASANRTWLYVICFLAALGAHAIGYVIYTEVADKRGPAPATITSDLSLWHPAPDTANISPATPPTIPPSQPPAPAPAKTPTIIYQDKPVAYQPAPESERRHPATRPRIVSGQTRAVIVDSAPATPPASTAAPASTAEAHAKVAEAHAYQHFRYKYKVGSANYTVTSLNIVTDETVEVPNWNRHRTTGEAGIEYYDNASGQRTTRKFEVLTELKNGRIVPVDITVK